MLILTSSQLPNPVDFIDFCIYYIRAMSTIEVIKRKYPVSPRAREVFESLRSENRLIGAEILENIEQPDASEIKPELRWPVKSAVVEAEHPFGDMARKAKSYPSTYNYVTINFNRVQKAWSADYGLETAWAVSIEGERVEDVRWASGSLSPWHVEEAIKRAFSNPKTKDFEASLESLQGERG